jgi:hypothetical protein
MGQFQSYPGPAASWPRLSLSIIEKVAMRGVFAMFIKDKTGGPLLQAELQKPLPNAAPILMADNGRRCIEIDAKDAAQYYRLISATKREVDQLRKAVFRMEQSDEFVARDE